MTLVTEPKRNPGHGVMKWVPEGAYVVYPVDLVVAMFGHKDDHSTRGMMAKRGYTMVRGWPVDEVEWVLEHRDPGMVQAWRDRKRKTEEK